MSPARAVVRSPIEPSLVSEAVSPPYESVQVEFFGALMMRYEASVQLGAPEEQLQAGVPLTTPSSLFAAPSISNWAVNEPPPTLVT